MTTFDLRRLRLWSGQEHREAVEIELEPLHYGGQSYLPVPGTVLAELTLDCTASGILFLLRFDARFFGPCYRCLGDAELSLTISGQEYQASSPGEAEELQTPYLADDLLDLSRWARDAVALALPEKILCRPECAGLCPECGRDLNREPHEHVHEEVDPRWGPLAELRDELGP